MHKFCGYGDERFPQSELQSVVVNNRNYCEVKERIFKTEILIIDECSVMSKAVLRSNTNKYLVCPLINELLSEFYPNFARILNMGQSQNPKFNLCWSSVIGLFYGGLFTIIFWWSALVTNEIKLSRENLLFKK